MLGHRDALPLDLYRKCKFFEEEGVDLPRSELHSDDEEQGEKPQKSDGDSNLVKDSMVGNVFAPIVRVVGLEDKPKNESVHREFIVLNYLPLRSSSFNEVEQELTDGMGNPMKFNQGKSVAIFHFRKKSMK